MSILNLNQDLFSVILIKIPVEVLVEINKLVFKYIWKSKETRIVKTILVKKNKIGELLLPDFKSCYRHTLIKTVDSGTQEGGVVFSPDHEAALGVSFCNCLLPLMIILLSSFGPVRGRGCSLSGF